MRSVSVQSLIIYCIVLILALSFLHYFSQRPLWLDEQFIDKIIRDYQYGEIFGPLDSAQAFPKTYLTVIKAFSSVFDFHLLALRFFPLVMLLGALILWVKLYRDNLADPWLVLLGLFSFAGSYRLMYYAAELKPYSMDVFVVALYSLFLIYQKRFMTEPPTRSLYFIVTFLPLLILFSYGGLFVFWMVSYNFILIWKKNKKVWPALLLNLGSVLLCFWVVYSTDLQYSVRHNALQDYWKSYFLNPNSILSFTTPLWEGFRKIVTWWYGSSRFLRQMAMPLVPLFLWALGRLGWRSWREDHFKIFTIDSVLIVLFLELMVFSIFRVYPFVGERITLFLAPLVFYAVVKAIGKLRKMKPLYYGYMIFYVGFLLVCLVNTTIQFFSLYMV